MHAPPAHWLGARLVLIFVAALASGQTRQYAEPSDDGGLPPETPAGQGDSSDSLSPVAARPGNELPVPAAPAAPPTRNDAEIDAAFALQTRMANSSSANATGYSLTPTLARSFHTTPWLDRDRRHASKARILDGQKEDNYSFVGDMSESDRALYMTRHGLYRRADAKFAEFIAQTTGQGTDGYGIWRDWESHGKCPLELLIADPWGSVTWEGAGGEMRPMECSWVIRPGMYRHGGYFKLSRAPVVLSFRSFSLAAPIQILTVYDGAHPDAPVLAQFSGPRLPGQISSTGAEVRIVLSADVNRSSSEVWSSITDSVSQGRLPAAQSSFMLAARCRLVGFFKQDMRRIIKAIAIRESAKPVNAWMRRKWFEGRGNGFDREYNMSLASLLQDSTTWQKRHRNEESKGHIAWDALLSPRRYPSPIREPGQNPFYPDPSTGSISVAVDADPLVQLQRMLGHLEWQSSGFSLDFTTMADCRGRGIAPSGEGLFPPLTMSSEPITNFEFLPFPLQVSSCQAMIASGPQTTRDRPFTCAHPVAFASSVTSNLLHRHGQCQLALHRLPYVCLIHPVCAESLIRS